MLGKGKFQSHNIKSLYSIGVPLGGTGSLWVKIVGICTDNKENMTFLKADSHWLQLTCVGLYPFRLVNANIARSVIEVWHVVLYEVSSGCDMLDSNYSLLSKLYKGRIVLLVECMFRIYDWKQMYCNLSSNDQIEMGSKCLEIVGAFVCVQPNRNGMIKSLKMY
ncbi:hypothetical protein M758_UG334400 [Ceratodon purpureus]|nr:hypothetical protein M758_UG334400 [Ceratodon purpureus]